MCRFVGVKLIGEVLTEGLCDGIHIKKVGLVACSVQIRDKLALQLSQWKQIVAVVFGAKAGRAVHQNEPHIGVFRFQGGKQRVAAALECGNFGIGPAFGVISIVAYRIVNKVVNGALFLSHPNPFLSIKLVQHVKFINLLCDVADQKMNVILRDIQTAMTEKL